MQIAYLFIPSLLAFTCFLNFKFLKDKTIRANTSTSITIENTDAIARLVFEKSSFVPLMLC